MRRRCASDSATGVMLRNTTAGSATRSAMRASSVDTVLPGQTSPVCGSYGCSPVNAHCRSSTRTGQSAGISAMMRRMDGSVCCAPIEGMGTNRTRRATSRAPAPRPMTSRSNTAAFAGRDSWRRRTAASRNPVSTGAAAARGRGAKSPSNPRNSKWSRRGGVSYPTCRKDAFGGCVNNCRDLPRSALTMRRRSRFRRCRSTRLSSVPGWGTAVSPAPAGDRTAPG